MECYNINGLELCAEQAGCDGSAYEMAMCSFNCPRDASQVIVVAPSY
jgi:hypothetical protein